MPDLRSELEKVIHAWEQPEQSEPTDQPQITHNSMTTETTYNEFLFNFVRDNPGLTGKQIEERTKHYVPQASIASLLGQMRKRHLVNKTNGPAGTHVGGAYTVATDKYMTTSEQIGLRRREWMSKKKRTKKAPAKSRATTSQQQDLFTPPAPPQLDPITPVAPQVFRQAISVHDLDIESLTIGEARALRDKLNALFGA